MGVTVDVLVPPTEDSGETSTVGVEEGGIEVGEAGSVAVGSGVLVGGESVGVSVVGTEEGSSITPGALNNVGGVTPSSDC